MAVSILSRPFGYIVDLTQPIECFIDNRIGRADVAKSDRSNHGLGSGDVVYVKSEVANYNGFWVIEVFDSNEFYLLPYSGTNYVQFIRLTGSTTAGDIQQGIAFYYVVYSPNLSVFSRHTWNCVHLPITYLLSNTRWPINSVDTIRDITNVTNSNGYCNITTSGDIKASGSASALEFVVITGCTDDSLNKVWQIITYSSDTSFILNIPYSSANDTDLTNNASLQYYYNNYVAKVQIWGGFNNAHKYYAQKPYELISILDLVPNEDNTILLSISNILKKQIDTNNNLLLGTMPNNTEAWTKFFIKYDEEYDDSDGTTLSRSQVTYVSDLDVFEGIAMDSILPFKNIYSGAMSGYVLQSGFQKFLTLFETPVIFQGFPYYIGLIWDGVNDIFLKKDWYRNNQLQQTTFSNNIDAFYTGVYRVNIDDDCTYDRLDITAYKAIGIQAANNWTNLSGSFDSRTATQFVETVSPPLSTVEAWTSINVPVGYVVRWTVTVNITGTWTPATGILVTSRLTDSSNNTRSNNLTTDSTTFTVNGTYTINYILEGITSTATRLVISLVDLMSSGSAVVTITIPTTVKIIGASEVISETKTLDINCNCVPSKSEDGIYLMWSNYLGDFDQWLFTAYKDHIVDIEDSGETEVNTFPTWPNSYGEFADTSNRKQTFRKSVKQLLVRSQNLTLDQLNAIQYIKTSPLVQIVNSIYDRRTVIVDNDSFNVYQEGQKEQYTISFTITYTDDVPSQRV